MPSSHLGVGLRFWQSVVNLGGVWEGLYRAANSSKSAGDEIGGALIPHAEHHGGAHVENVALPLKSPRTAARDYIPTGGGGGGQSSDKNVDTHSSSVME